MKQPGTLVERVEDSVQPKRQIESSRVAEDVPLGEQVALALVSELNLKTTIGPAEHRIAERMIEIILDAAASEIESYSDNVNANAFAAVVRSCRSIKVKRFKSGDRVRHVSRDEIGTVTVAPNGDVHVLFDNPNSRGRPSIGIYDANWFEVYPNGLIASQSNPPRNDGASSTKPETGGR